MKPKDNPTSPLRGRGGAQAEGVGGEGLAESGVQTLTLPLRGPLPLPRKAGEGFWWLRQRRQQKEAVQGQQRSERARGDRQDQDPAVEGEDRDRTEDERKLEEDLGEVEIVVALRRLLE